MLTYHSLDRSGSVISTDPTWFAETIACLVEAGFVGVDLADWIARGRPPVEKGFAVTFDDGLRSVLDGLETLERFALPATVFLVTAHVGRLNDWPGQPPRIPRGPMLDWSEIADLSQRGFTIGSHSATHPRLARSSSHDLPIEIQGSRETIETQLQRPCELFAYPYGILSRQARDLVGRSYAAAFTTALDSARARHDRFALPRLDAYYLRNPGVVRRLINGTLASWITARSALRVVRRLASSLIPVRS